MPVAGLAGLHVSHLAAGFVAVLIVHSMMSTDINNKEKYAKLEKLMKGGSPDTMNNQENYGDSNQDYMEDETFKTDPFQDNYHYYSNQYENEEYNQNYQESVPYEMQEYFNAPSSICQQLQHVQNEEYNQNYQQSIPYFNAPSSFYKQPQHEHNQYQYQYQQHCSNRYAARFDNAETVPLEDSSEDSGHRLVLNNDKADLEEEAIEQMKHIFKKHPKHHMDRTAYKIIATPVTNIKINIEDMRKRLDDSKDQRLLKNKEGSSLNEEQVLKIINALGKNYASKENGAAICSVKAEPLLKPNLIHKFFGLKYLTNKPINMIKDDLGCGCCFAFSPPEASVVVKLSEETPVRKILIEHTPRSRANKFNIDNAPKDLLVYGCNINERAKVYFLGAFTFELNPGTSPQFQIFDTQVYDANLTHIYVNFESNHGNPNVTCVYRFAVYNLP